MLEYNKLKLAPPFVLKPTTTRSVEALENRTRNRFPKLSQAADTSPSEVGKAETLLDCQVTPPSVLYRVARLQVSLTNRLAGFSGLTAIVVSALLAVLRVVFRFGPTDSVPA